MLRAIDHTSPKEVLHNLVELTLALKDNERTIDSLEQLQLEIAAQIGDLSAVASVFMPDEAVTIIVKNNKEYVVSMDHGQCTVKESTHPNDYTRPTKDEVLAILAKVILNQKPSDETTVVERWRAPDTQIAGHWTRPSQQYAKLPDND